MTLRQRALRAWYAVLALLTVAVAACGPIYTDGNAHLPAVNAYDFWVDPSVDAETSAAIDVAVQQWTAYTDVRITRHTGPHVCVEEGCFNIIETSQADLDAVVGENYIGWTVPYLITLTTPKTWDEAQDTATHEMGHALGLWHPCTAPCSDYAVMNPTYGNGAHDVVCADVAMFYAERGRDVPNTVTACTETPAPPATSAAPPAPSIAPSSDGSPTPPLHNGSLLHQ